MPGFARSLKHPKLAANLQASPPEMLVQHGLHKMMGSLSTLHLLIEAQEIYSVMKDLSCQKCPKITSIRNKGSPSMIRVMLQYVLVYAICLLFFTLVWLPNLQEIPDKVIKFFKVSCRQNPLQSLSTRGMLSWSLLWILQLKFAPRNDEITQMLRYQDLQIRKTYRHRKDRENPWKTLIYLIWLCKTFRASRRNSAAVVTTRGCRIGSWKKNTLPSTPFSLIQISWWMERERWMHFWIVILFTFSAKNLWQSQHLQKLQRPNTSDPWTSTTPIFKWSCFPPPSTIFRSSAVNAMGTSDFETWWKMTQTLRSSIDGSVVYHVANLSSWRRANGRHTWRWIKRLI